MSLHENIDNELFSSVENNTTVRNVTIKPAMCGHNSLFVGQIGDWTWETVNQLCDVNTFKAVDVQGTPTYLSFFYYHIIGDKTFNLRTPTFGDQLQIISTCFDFGSESILTLHRITKKEQELPSTFSINEFFVNRYPGCLYVQNFNRWVQRGVGGNKELYTASPLNFRYGHLDKLTPEYSPRNVYDFARRNGAFVHEESYQLMNEWTESYEIDMARDLNGVGLLYFASYFSIVDTVLGKVWRQMNRTVSSFLDRVELEKQFCFLGNTEAGVLLTIQIRRYMSEKDNNNERFDIQVIERETQRMLAIVALTFTESI